MLNHYKEDFVISAKYIETSTLRLTVYGMNSKLLHSVFELAQSNCV